MSIEWTPNPARSLPLSPIWFAPTDRFLARREIPLYRRHGATHKENGPRHIRRYTVDANGAELSGGKIFAESTSGLFDGFRVDRNGRIWTSSAEGVHCYEVDGTLIGKILIPEIVANVTFGGAKLNRLFICETTSLYSMYVTANGSKLG
jgi:gluconolactonase